MFSKLRQKFFGENSMDQKDDIKDNGKPTMEPEGHAEGQENFESILTSVAVEEDAPPPTAESSVENQDGVEIERTVGEQHPQSTEQSSETPLSQVKQEVKASTPNAVEPRKSTVSLDQYVQIKGEKEELHQRLLRLQAEFENFRKRTVKEKQDFFEYVLADFLRELLPILDGFERGLFAPDGETVENFKTGFQLILKQFNNILFQAGLQPIRTTGQLFNPNYHQAVMREETKAVADNVIISEMQRGYTFKERLLRPSLVNVAVAPRTLASTVSAPDKIVGELKETGDCPKATAEPELSQKPAKSEPCNPNSQQKNSAPRSLDKLPALGSPEPPEKS